jgi:hypothetical protein
VEVAKTAFEMELALQLAPAKGKKHPPRKTLRIVLIWFDCGSCRYAVGAAATVQGRCRVVHSLGLAMTHQGDFAVPQSRAVAERDELKSTDYPNPPPLCPSRSFAAIPHSDRFGLIHLDSP